MNPICVNCQIEFRSHKNGVISVSMAAYGPQSIRRADLLKCPGCGAEILHGFAAEEEIHVFESAFQSRLDSYELDPREQVIRYWMNQREKDQSRRLVGAKS